MAAAAMGVSYATWSRKVVWNRKKNGIANASTCEYDDDADTVKPVCLEHKINVNAVTN
jgi:hypothetical protein